jgi:DNA polymerase-4
MRPPAIVFVDIDAFFASVEQVRNPRLRGRPVVVGTGCIASCSYEARAFGLRAGMSLREARRLCPHAAFLAGEYPAYKGFADAIFALCRDVSPAVETYLDEAYLDLSGTERLHGPLLPLGRALQARIRSETGLGVTIGIGANRMVARLAAKGVKPAGVARVPPGEERDFVAARPIEDLPGAGPKTARFLRRAGIARIEDLRAVPVAYLERVFGARGRALHDRAWGRDTRAVTPREVPREISRETSLHEPTVDRDEATGMLYYLVERAAKTARELGVRAGALGVSVRYADLAGDAATRALPRATALDGELFEAACALFASVATRRVAVRNVGVVLSRFVPAVGEALDLWEPAGRTRERRLVGSLDAVRARFGHAAIVAGRSLNLLGKLERTRHGYVLRTPSLTK